jgi:phage terminase small subunit
MGVVMNGRHLVGAKAYKGRRTDAIAVAEIPVVKPEEYFKLTERQRKFCELYVSRDDLTLTQCAMEAGYNAGNMGSHLLKHGPAIAYIKKLRAEVNAKYEVTFESHVRKLAEIRDIALQNGAYAAAVTAEKHRGQVAGLYIDRKEILHGRLDQMSRDDVMKEIAKLQQEFPGLSTIFETNKVIEHQTAEVTEYHTVEQGENGETSGEQVQPEIGDGNQS